MISSSVDIPYAKARIRRKEGREPTSPISASVQPTSEYLSSSPTETSLLSSSLKLASAPITKIPQNNYRDIKTRYFNSLKLQSPLEQQRLAAKDPSPNSLQPSIPPAKATVKQPKRRNSSTAIPIPASQPIVINPTTAPAKPFVEEQNSSLLLMDDEEDELELGNDDYPELEETEGDASLGAKSFLPPHLITRRSDFSVYQKTKHRDLQRIVGEL